MEEVKTMKEGIKRGFERAGRGGRGRKENWKEDKKTEKRRRKAVEKELGRRNWKK